METEIERPVASGSEVDSTFLSLFSDAERAALDNVAELTRNKQIEPKSRNGRGNGMWPRRLGTPHLRRTCQS